LAAIGWNAKRQNHQKKNYDKKSRVL
jgi:hypothetical protein